MLRPTLAALLVGCWMVHSILAFSIYNTAGRRTTEDVVRCLQQQGRPLFMAEDPSSDGYDEETVRNPSSEIEKLKAEMKEAQENGDMDTVMTIMGTLLAIGGGYDGEVGPAGGSSEGKCAD